MNRQSNWPLLASFVVAATALAGSCTPNNNPPPGSPVLTEAFIIENGASATKIPAGTPQCSTQATGFACDPMPSDPTIPTICEDIPNGNWCRCAPNTAMTPATPPPPPDGGTTDDGGTADGGTTDDASADGPPPPPGLWNCDPFALNSGVLYVFDRLLDTAPLGTGSGGVAGVADAAWMPAPVNALAAGADYGSNGAPGSILFPILGAFRADGPSLFITGQPDPAGRSPSWSPWTGALPATAKVTFTLNKNAVLAKDGVNAFVAAEPFVDGAISFATQSFSATLTVPTPPPPADPDAGPGPDTVPPDMTPAVATFTGPVDSTKVTTHVTVTAAPAGGGAAAPIDFLVLDVDGVNVQIVAAVLADGGLTPTTWPASSVITVTVDGTTPSVAGDQLGAAGALSGTFTTSAM